MGLPAQYTRWYDARYAARLGTAHHNDMLQRCETNEEIQVFTWWESKAAMEAPTIQRAATSLASSLRLSGSPKVQSNRICCLVCGC